MSLINKIKQQEFASLANLQPRTNNMESFITDFVYTPEDCIPFDFEVYLPSKNMNLQRELVWTIDQKKELIKSIILGREINQPTIIINRKNGKKIIEVIDGKQRINSIIEFMQNKFDVEGYYHSDFGHEFKVALSVRCTLYYSYEENPITDNQKIQLFKLLNFGGTPQDKDHLNNLSK